MDDTHDFLNAGDLPTGDPEGFEEIAQEQKAVQLQAGDIVANRFEVVRQLGAGGMGAVYLVKDSDLKEERAMKVMLPSLLRSEKARERFLEEIKISQRLSNDYIVRVHDLGKDEERGIQFFTMEHVEGVTLSRKMKEGGMSPEETLGLMRQLCEGMAYAHQYTIHRDLKPQNIMVQPNGKIKILDFGLARLLGSEQMHKFSMALGTAYYQAPEQSVHLREVDQRADIYSLGVIFYQMLTGKIPVGMISPASTLNPNSPAYLDDVISKCLSPEMEDRYPDVGAQLEAMDRGASGGAAAKKPKPKKDASKKLSGAFGTVLAVVLLLVVGGIGAFWYSQQKIYDTEDQRFQASSRRAQNQTTEAGDTVVIVNVPQTGESVAVRIKQLEKEKAEADSKTAAAELESKKMDADAAKEVKDAKIAADKKTEDDKIAAATKMAADKKLADARKAEDERIAKETEDKRNAISARNTAQTTAASLRKLIGPKERQHGSAPFASAEASWKKAEEAGERYDVAKLEYDSASNHYRSAIDLGKGPASGTRKTFDGIEFAWIRRGVATLGSPESDTRSRADETPYRATISNGFWMGRYEITQAQWERVMGSNPSQFKATDKPVDNLSWDDAQQFIDKLNGSNSGFRLPTEAEWEYALRAGSSTSDDFGDRNRALDSLGWYNGNSDFGSSKVGQKKANGWGLHDMRGNVWEWCSDWYADYPSASVSDPTGSSSGSSRVLRGGSWESDANACRLSARYQSSPMEQHYTYGLRLVRESR